MRADENLEYHLARLLILLHHFGKPKSKGLDGLTKLAKLDFLLRYPSFTDHLLSSRGASWPIGCEPNADELNAVESRMIRYKYGPWDHRYFSLLGRLVGYELAETVNGKGRISIRLTEKGDALATQLASTSDWRITYERSEMLRRNFNLSGNKLKQMIYESLPDAVNRPHWEAI
ncbi:hypothetical protein [Streptomyces canus]|uniref:hypothetical protein n=1 Tax=Streptomyces canus TaxID=58343 RepID=UPI0030E405AF